MRDSWGYVRDHRAALGLALAVTLLASVAALAQPLAAKAVVDALGSGATLTTPLLLLTGLVLISAGAAGGGAWLLGRTGERVVLAIRRRLSFRLTRLRVAELDRHDPGNLSPRPPRTAICCELLRPPGWCRSSTARCRSSPRSP